MLSTSEYDKQTEREIPASNEDGVCSVSFVKYNFFFENSVVGGVLFLFLFYNFFCKN